MQHRINKPIVDAYEKMLKDLETNKKDPKLNKIKKSIPETEIDLGIIPDPEPIPSPKPIITEPQEEDND